MKRHHRPYTSEADLSALLTLKQRCSTPQNISEWPTISDLRRLLIPPESTASRQKTDSAP